MAKAFFFKETNNQCPVKWEMKKLSKTDQGIVSQNIYYLGKNGRKIGIPELNKIEENLWELRSILTSGNKFKILICFLKGNDFCLLTSFKRRKAGTPIKYLNKARERKRILIKALKKIKINL
jgi:hypothetical protein